MRAKKDPIEEQRENPRPDFDFEKEVKPDNTVPPVGDFEKPDEKK